MAIPTPPIPKRFTKEYQERIKQNTLRNQQIEIQKQEQQKQQAEQQNTTEPTKGQLIEYYKSIYPERIAGYYASLYQAQKKLEQLKKENANYQLIYEQQKIVNSYQQDIARASKARDTGSPKIPIQRTYIQESFSGGYSTGYQASFPMGGTVTPIVTSQTGGYSTNQGPVLQTIKADYTPATIQAEYSQEINYTQPEKKYPNMPFYQAQEQKKFFDYLYGEVEKVNIESKKPGKEIGKYVSAGARALIGSSEFVLGLTPFYYKPYSTISGVTGYTGETISYGLRSRGKNFSSEAIGEAPIDKTSREIKQYIGYRGIDVAVVEFVVGAKAVGPIFEPFENFLATKGTRVYEKVLGVDDATLRKNYSVEQILGGKNIVIREKSTGRFAPTSKAPITLEPTQTVLVSPEYLRSLEGKTVLGVHTSPNFPKGKNLELVYVEPGGIRGKLEYAPFHVSLPRENTLEGFAQVGYAGVKRSGLTDVYTPQTFSINPFRKKPTMLVVRANINPSGKTINVQTPKNFLPLEKKLIDISAYNEKFLQGKFTRSPIEVSKLRAYGTELEATVSTGKSSYPLTGREPSVAPILTKKVVGKRFYYEKIEPGLFLLLPMKIRQKLFETDFSTKPIEFSLEYGKISPGKILPSGNKKDDIKKFNVADERVFETENVRTPKNTIRNIETTKEERFVEPEKSFRLREFERPSILRRFDTSIKTTIFIEPRSPIRRFEERPILQENFRFPGFPDRPIRIIERRLPDREIPRFPENRINYRESPRPPIPRTTTIRTPTRPIKKDREYQTQNINKGFSRAFVVETRKGGKIVRIPKTFTYQDAVNYAGNLVQNTARASFRIKPVTGKARQIGITRSNVIVEASKRPGGFMVEPSKYRLNVKSEIKDVTGNRFKKFKRGFLA